MSADGSWIGTIGRGKRGFEFECAAAHLGKAESAGRARQGMCDPDQIRMVFAGRCGQVLGKGSKGVELIAGAIDKSQPQSRNGIFSNRSLLDREEPATSYSGRAARAAGNLLGANPIQILLRAPICRRKGRAVSLRSPSLTRASRHR